MIRPNREILAECPRLVVLGSVLVLSSFAFTLPTKAEEEPVVHGWAHVLPAVRVDERGQPEGFSIDLARRIADVAGLELSLKRFDSVPAWIQGQTEGGSDMLSGAAELPGLQRTNLFSMPVATTSVRLFLRAEESNSIDLASFVNRKIGTVPPVAGSEPSPLLERNINVTLPSLGTALIRLLSGEIDGVLLPEEAMLSEAHAASLDHRITTVGAPVREFNRVVAIHESRAELLELVNAAIAELEADGELAEMRRRWFLEAPPPPPEVLTVGVVHFPPYQVINEDGSFTGLAVEALRDLATRAGLDLQMAPIASDAFSAGPSEGGYDILPQASISDEQRSRFEFTRPIVTEWVSIFVLQGRAAGRVSLDDFKGRSIGVAAANIGRRIAETGDGVDAVVFGDQSALLDGLLRGEIDAALVTESSFRRAILNQGVSNRIERLRSPVYETERAVALRRELGVVRERLNAVLPAYLASSDYRAHRDRWLGGESSIWADQRVGLLILISMGTLIALLALIVVSTVRRRDQILRERRRFAAEIAEHIPIGLLLVSPEGQIDFANREIKERTPGGEATLLEGQSYRLAIKSLIDRGLVDIEGRDPGEMLKIMTEDGLADGYSRELRLVEGSGVFLRTTKRLKSGSALIVRQDITDYRRQVQQIEALNDDLGEQIRHAEVANQELRAFAYATSHDLKAPTNTLMMSLDALVENLEGKLEADDRDLIDVAKRTISRMRSLIDDILTYTNTIASAPEREPVDLNKVASDVLEALRADIEVNAAEIKLTPLPTLKASPTQMHQLVQNLISNAVKFHRPDQTPAIDIEATDAPPGYVAFKVKDNGIGIAPEQQGKVFELFARLNRHSNYAGTGLGLAICQRIALNHGGRIDLQSTPGDGTCFTVLLEEETDDPPSHAD